MSDWLSARLELFNKLKAEYDNANAAKAAEVSEPINVTLIPHHGLFKKTKECVFPLSAFVDSPASFWKKLDERQFAAIEGKKPAKKQVKKVPVEAYVCLVNGEPFHFDRVFTESCSVEFLPLTDERCSEIFRHSAAHVLGYASENVFDRAKLGHGPCTTYGFFYDVHVGGDRNTVPVTERDCEKVQAEARRIIKEEADSEFNMIEITRDQALELFAEPAGPEGPSFKHHWISSKVAEGETCTVYRCGSFVDFCRGPHLARIGALCADAFEVEKVGAAYWLGNQANPSMSRIYAVAFARVMDLAAHKKRMKEIAEADHRTIIAQQGLAFSHPVSPGSFMWKPAGTRIYRGLQNYMRQQYFERGLDEVITPNMANIDLWRVSGHWKYYREDMFSFYEDQHATTDELMLEWMTKVLEDKKTREEVEAVAAERGPCACCADAEHEGLAMLPGIGYYDKNDGLADQQRRMALAAMNCPFHCLMFKSEKRTGADLPIRFTDFNNLHRNEASGALTGLTRVRKFAQDDGHIFCRLDQVEDEILGTLNLMLDVYKVFNFDFRLALSTRPAKAFGAKEIWDDAEARLAGALDKFKVISGKSYGINEADGAFYGPKIDIELLDAMGRHHQCATIQLDFQLPFRFDLKYQADNKGTVERPVIVHRAILGSTERFFAVLAEHCRGAWPFWLAPRQIMVASVLATEGREQDLVNYCKEIQTAFRRRGFFCDVDTRNNSISEKLSSAMGPSHKYNMFIGVGMSELDDPEHRLSVNVRGFRGTFQNIKIDDLVDAAVELRDSHAFNMEPMIEKLQPYKK